MDVMKHLLVTVFLALTFIQSSAFAIAKETAPDCKEVVGSAKLGADGVITLDVLVSGDVGSAQVLLEILPSQKSYNEFLRRIGGLKLGQSKDVRLKDIQGLHIKPKRSQFPPKG